MLRGKRITWTISAVSLAAGVWVGSAINLNAEGAATQPGSVDDPLVTKSYVDQAIAQKIGGGSGNASGTGTGQAPDVGQAKAAIQAELAKAKEELQNLSKQIGAGGGSGQTPNGGGAALKIEVLKPGMKLFAGEGATVIVRNGDVQAISTDGNGIPDLTSGTDIQHGQKVEPNHLLLFPREGTRGITPGPKQKEDVWVVIQGRYTLLDGNASSSGTGGQK